MQQVDTMTRCELADAMWNNLDKLPEQALDRLAIVNFSDYISAVADELNLEKESVNRNEMKKSRSEQPDDAVYAHHDLKKG